MVSNFEDYIGRNLQNENTLAIEMRTHFTEVAMERCFSDLCYYENHLKASVKKSNFERNSDAFLGKFQGF